MSMGIPMQALKKIEGEKEHRAEVAALYDTCKKYVPADKEAKLHHLLVEIGEFSSWDIEPLAANDEDANRLWSCLTGTRKG